MIRGQVVIMFLIYRLSEAALQKEDDKSNANGNRSVKIISSK